MRKINFIIFTFMVVMLNLGISFSQKKPEIILQLRHSGFVTSVTSSPDYVYVLLVICDKRGKLWEV